MSQCHRAVLAQVGACMKLGYYTQSNLHVRFRESSARSPISAQPTATMNTHCGLEQLSPEVQVLILAQLDSVQSLYSLIRASSRLYQVFRASKRQILSAFLRHRIHPEVLHIAIATAEAANLSLRCADKDIVLKFVEDLGKRDNSYYTEKVLALETSIPLCYLQPSIDHFLHEFTRQSSTILQRWSLSLGREDDAMYRQNLPLSYSSLSDTEKGRLQRAFYRVELYGHLFQNGDCRSQDQEIGADEQADSFFAKLTPWEIEELACIRDYFHNQFGVAFDRLEDEVFDAKLTKRWEKENAKSTSSVRNRDEDDHYEEIETDNASAAMDLEETQDDEVNSDDESTHASSSELDETEDDNQESADESLSTSSSDQTDRWWTTDYFFSDDDRAYQHEDMMEYILSMGLSSARHFLAAGSQEQTQLVVADTSRCSDFLGCAMSVRHLSSLVHRRKNSEFTGDNLVQSNIGWVWSSSECLPSRSWNHDDSKALRDWGYVFWDEATLKAAGILDER